jgi:hypothetical protein
MNRRRRRTNKNLTVIDKSDENYISSAILYADLDDNYLSNRWNYKPITERVEIMLELERVKHSV